MLAAASLSGKTSSQIWHMLKYIKRMSVVLTVNDTSRAKMGKQETGQLEAEANTQGGTEQKFE
ncbi:MAG: hypothetical protein M1830_003621 [Pleopsidium flavum]|nr:MAG: hypothetical protein M1830_003621 [Pleopsidium flavum]